MSYECRTCHTVQETAEGLCQPVEDKGDCGSYTEVHRNLGSACAPVKMKVDYFCQGCGRLTEESEEVCLPARVRL